MYNFMQIYGSCAAVHYLGPNRIKGPVDNVIAKGTDCIKALLTDTYLDYIKNEEPTIEPRNPLFEGDSPIYYCFSIVNIVHEDPKTEKYQVALAARLENFKDFLTKVKTDKNYYFVYSLNVHDVNNKEHKLNGNILLENIKFLKENGLLDKTIFVGCTPGKSGRKWWNFWTNDLIPLIKQYHLKYTEVTEMHYGITPKEDLVLAEQFQQQVASIIKNGTDKKYLQKRDNSGKFIIEKPKKTTPVKKQTYLYF